MIGDIVINELMYDPISGNDDDQYIELYNKGTNTINMAGWQFTSGVTFTFPNVAIAPNGYLVVEGSKIVQVNGEKQTVTVRGVVRPADLAVAAKPANQRGVSYKGAAIPAAPRLLKLEQTNCR